MKHRTKVIHTTVYLYPDDVFIAKKLGAGNLSNGVRAALEIAASKMYPNLLKADVTNNPFSPAVEAEKEQ